MNYIHDEWCDLDKTGKCDCYVATLKDKDEQIANLEAIAQALADELIEDDLQLESLFIY